MVNKVDLSLLEKASKKARYGSEVRDAARTPIREANVEGFEKIGDVEKPLPGRVAKGYQVRVPASSTVLWSGNPRNFESDVDVSDLKPLLTATNGNTEAVTARLKDGKLQIIAGKRRRMACLELDLPILANVFDNLSDDECHFVADIENRGRKDLTHIAYCQYLAQRYDELCKDPSTRVTVEEFGEKYRINRTTMQNKISTGRLPRYLFESVADMNMWGVRQSSSVLALYNKLRDISYIDDSNIKDALASCRNPTDVISALTSLAGEGANNKDTPKTQSMRVGQGTISIKHGRSGALTVKVDSKVSSDVKERLEAFLASLQ